MLIFDIRSLRSEPEWYEEVHVISPLLVVTDRVYGASETQLWPQLSSTYGLTTALELVPVPTLSA